MPMSMGGLHSPVKQLFPTPPSEEKEGTPNVSPVGRDFAHVPTYTYAHTHMHMHTHTIHTREQKKKGGFATRHVAGHVLTCSEYYYLELPTSSHVSWWNCSRR